MAVAHPVLQRNAPLPPALMGGRAREWVWVARVAARRGDGAIARKPLRPVLVSGLERLLDQQPAKAGAVDEELAFDDPAVGKLHRFDESVLAAKLDVDDLAFDPVDAVALGER